MLKLIKYDNANALEATWLDEEGNQIASIAYHETQMGLLRADVAKYGGDLAEYEALIADVEANITPYVAPVLTPEELAAIAKQAKDAALNAITVITTSGKVFDGNEASITRMLAAIASSEFLGVTVANWKLADNTMVLVTLNEVKEALALAIQRVGEIVTA